jgi:D-alanyl-lipoteichoic acid acyltransferase DltB (MBOAT superfamily)
VLFNSFPFILLFLPLTLLGFYGIGQWSRQTAAAFLAAASLIFYGCWDWHYVPLLVLSICFNFVFANLILRTKGRTALIAAIAGNLTLLGYYKYANFFVSTLDNSTGLHWTIGAVILPLGISFFTFTQIAFLVDTYRGIVRERSFVPYVLFVSYFPHLIAGPVLHHAEMMPQFSQPQTYRLDAERLAVGLTLFVFGLAKKELLADGIAPSAQAVFGAAALGHPVEFFHAWIGALAYAMQIYFDFSAYSDMALGISFIFGIRLPLNFDSPYKATSIIDFWRRWHMTLSRFLRDYLYIPLGGSRRSPSRRYINLMVTMLLGGLWHGAGWTYVIWGGLHGVYLVINHGWRWLRQFLGLSGGGRLGRGAGVLLTFLAVTLAWVFFRSPDLASAMVLLKGMLGQSGADFPGPVGRLAAAVMGPAAPQWAYVSNTSIVELVLLILASWFLPNGYQILGAYSPSLQAPQPPRARLAWSPSLSWALFLGFLSALAVSQILSGAPSEFIYFQF